MTGGLPDPEETLFWRLGGESGIRGLLVAFYGKVLADPALKPFFVDVSMEKLLAMQQEFFATALDGPHRYAGRPLKDVHAGRGITGRHFLGFVQHLLETLQEAGANPDDIRDVVHRVKSLRKDVVG